MVRSTSKHPIPSVKARLGTSDIRDNPTLLVNKEGNLNSLGPTTSTFPIQDPVPVALDGRTQPPARTKEPCEIEAEAHLTIEFTQPEQPQQGDTKVIIIEGKVVDKEGHSTALPERYLLDGN